MAYAWPTDPYTDDQLEILAGLTPEEEYLSIAFSWAFPIVHDIIRPVYNYILRDDLALVEQLSRIHGAAVIALLSDGSCNRQEIIAYLYETYEHLGLDHKNCITLHRLIVTELTAVISVRNRQSPRRRAELEAIIAMRLGLRDNDAASGWATPPDRAAA